MTSRLRDVRAMANGSKRHGLIGLTRSEHRAATNGRNSAPSSGRLVLNSSRGDGTLGLPSRRRGGRGGSIASEEVSRWWRIRSMWRTATEDRPIPMWGGVAPSRRPPGGRRPASLDGAEPLPDPFPPGSPHTVTVVICAYTEHRWDSLLNAIASLRVQRRLPDQILVGT